MAGEATERQPKDDLGGKKRLSTLFTHYFSFSNQGCETQAYESALRAWRERQLIDTKGWPWERKDYQLGEFPREKERYGQVY